jgi:hypothetical protein
MISNYPLIPTYQKNCDVRRWSWGEGAVEIITNHEELKMM